MHTKIRRMLTVSMILVMLSTGLPAAGQFRALVPTAEFSAAPTSGEVPLGVQFTDQSLGEPTGWAWYFGDETLSADWAQATSSAGWSGRDSHASVVLPDGGIVLMGGWDGGFKNDVWRSDDGGVTWTEVHENAGWSGRWGHTSVVLPDGRIVLMGGYNDSSSMNDVWRSDDGGGTWAQINVSAGWSGREAHTSVVLPDGRIVLMGGWDGSLKNDVWRSDDGGETWTEVPESAGWSSRRNHTSVVLPDGRIVLMGGVDEYWNLKNDVWYSDDGNETWTLVTDSAGWSARSGHTSVVLPDGQIVLMGGMDEGWVYSPMNDVWRLATAGSNAQNPQHVYTETGAYTVTLQVYNNGGIGMLTKPGYIRVGFDLHLFLPLILN